MAEYIEVHGLMELLADFRRLDPKLKRELQKELRKIAVPAAERAKKKATARHLSEYTVSGLRPGSRVGMAIVRQTRRSKTTDKTHKRKKFGPWQAEKIMEPAAVETMPEARARLERMLDRIATGFNEEGI